MIYLKYILSFQSTPPVKAATRSVVLRVGGLIFQSTPPVKAATREIVPTPAPAPISIHAAREGGDAVLYNLYKTFRISIHAAREGGDKSRRKPLYAVRYFNPRRP